MPDSPPKLVVSGPSAEPSYASISWTAVASLIVAVLFITMLLGFGGWSMVEKKPLIEQWLLFFPAIAVVLAFVARRQIRLSEGTRVGERYANTAWWIAVVGGLGYVAYLGAIEFVIRRDAEQSFVEYANHVKEIDPAKSDDEHLFGALLLTVDPGLRAGANPRKPETMDRFREQLVGFRQSDIYRQTVRNRGAAEITPLGLRDWQQKPNEITCTLTAQLATPEGEFELVVPMRAAVDDKKIRRWHILASPDGYIKKSSKSRYGWWVEYIDILARQYVGEFATALSIPGQTRFAYLGFVQPKLNPRSAAHAVLWEVPAVAGGLSLVPMPQNTATVEALFAKPGGGKPTPEEFARMLYCWNTGRIVRPGTILKAAQETYSTITIDDTGITVAAPVELAFTADGPGGGSAARARAILRFDRAADPKLLDNVLAARKLGRSSALTEQPPKDLDLQGIPWRIVRIESDMKAISPPAQPQGPPGGMGG